MKRVAWINAKGRRFSPPWLALSALTLIWSLACNEIRDFDFWWHLRTGQIIVETHQIPRQDPFSFSAAGRPWTAHEWLFEVGLFLLYRWGGWTAVIAAKALLLTLIAGVVLGMAWSATRNEALAVLVTVLVIVATMPGWLERPQLLTYLFLSLLLALLWGWQRGASPRWLWVLPFLTVLWVNIHGAYVVEFMVLGIYVAVGLGRWWWKGRPSEEWRRLHFLVVVSVLCGIASLLNPHTFQAWTYPVQYLGPSIHRKYIVEWASPDFAYVIFTPFLILLVVTVAAVVGMRRPLPTENLILFGLFAVMALQSRRHIPLFCLATVPVLGECVGSVWRAWQARLGERTEGALPGPHRWAWGLPVLGLAVGLLAAQGAWASWHTTVQEVPPVNATLFPAGAVAYLKAHPQPRRMFDHYSWGGYLIWNLPKNRVFIDGRADMYGPEIMEDYMAVCRLKPGWKEILRKYRIDGVLCPADQPLAAVLREMQEWKLVYADGTSTLFCSRSMDCPLRGAHESVAQGRDPR